MKNAKDRAKCLPVLLVSCLVVTTNVIYSSKAVAQSDARSTKKQYVDIRKELFANEPTADKVIEQSLKYFRLRSSDISGLRRRARLRGLIPSISADVAKDEISLDRNAEVLGVNSSRTTEGTVDERIRAAVGVTWDFRDLIFQSDEVGAYALVTQQTDLILEVSRTFYLRQQLVLQRKMNPPRDVKAQGILDLRIREFTTQLNMFTGGWFGRKLIGNSSR